MVRRMADRDGHFLCNPCWSIFSDFSLERARHSNEIEIKHHDSFIPLKQAKDDFCFVCSTLSDVSRQDVFTSYSLQRHSNAHVELVLKARCYNSGPVISSYFTIVPVQESSELSALARSARAESATGRQNATLLAQGWLKHCLNTHSGCASNLKPTWYPTRLLDITDGVRLVDGSDVEASQPYATLSHCWGDVRFKTLTQENESEFRAGLLFQDLPQTFQDIVAMSRALEIRYLWIDCFCILQSRDERTDDKIHEIGTMEHVYANALINFGAASASGPFEGCLYERAPLPQPLVVQWRPTSQDPVCTFYVFRQSEGLEHAGFFSNNQLFRRAWVLQERLLSPRMLHFHRRQLYWECNEIDLANENFPLGPLQTWTPRSAFPFSVPQPLPMAVGQWMLPSSDDLGLAWSDITKMYSGVSISSAEK